jgi:branched-chain amino acid transport system ATP-binding protein
VAFSFADRVTVLHQGKVFTEGSRDDVSANTEVQRIYLGELTQNKGFGVSNA